MPNSYFRAKYLWEHGENLEGAFALTNKMLGEQIGADPFARPEAWLLKPNGGFYESLVATLLTGRLTSSAESLLVAPFGRVWAALWRLDRHDQWIDILLSYDFFQIPSSLGFDWEDHAPPTNELRDFDAIIDMLAESARKGELSTNPMDRPNGGRPVLSLEMIDAVDDLRWGKLKQRLRARLAVAYAECPPDVWQHRATADPEGVAINFLHDLFGRYGTPNESSQPRWLVIQEAYPDYAAAARNSLTHLLSHLTAAQADEIVKIDARREVPDGLAWLRTLATAMETGSFSQLSDRVG